MKEQPTTELLDILNNIDKKDMSAYIKEFAATASAAAPFPEYIAEHGIAIADVVKRCRGILSKSYVYDILNGTKRNPSRDVVLLLCIAVHADRKQTRRLLEKYGHRDLYAKDTRDIIIATYINNKEYDIDRIKDELFQNHVSHLSTEH